LTDSAEVLYQSDEHAMTKKPRTTTRKKTLPAATLDRMHEAGVDLSAHLEVANAKRPGRAVQRVNDISRTKP
jgi:hypothetical protein